MGDKESRFGRNVDKAKTFYNRVVRNGEKSPLVGGLPPETQRDESGDASVSWEETRRGRIQVEDDR
jgi:hypothetical protein